MEINHDTKNKSVQFRIKSLSASKLFPSLDNLYTVDYDAGFLPYTFSRKINQDKLVDAVVTCYNRQLNNAVSTKNSLPKENSYLIENDSRDFFSFILMVMQNNLANGSYPIDGNGKSWTAKLEYLGDETLRTNLGKFNTSVYEIKLRPQTDEKTPYIDMISFNILDSEVSIQLWVTENQTAVKAVARKNKLISTSIDLVKIGS